VGRLQGGGTRSQWASYGVVLSGPAWVLAWLLVRYALPVEWVVAGLLSYASWRYVRKR
jgi:hypothetical protein